MNKLYSTVSREPLIRVAKKVELSGMKLVWISFIALLFAIVAGGIFILCLGHNPFLIYKTIVQGAFQSKLAMKGTVKVITPLLISSLGVTLAFKMKFWNIGAEGQIIVGAIFATYFALFHNNMPHFLLIIVMILAGMVGGGLWGLLPAYFKCKHGTNETLFTLMLNYIALYFIKYLAEGPWRDSGSSGFPKIASFVPNACLDRVFGVHVGWIIAFVLIVLVYFDLKYTKQGYEISVVGESSNTARYAGMNVKKIVMRTMFLSGAVCGIAGMTQATGAAMTLSEGVASGVGFTAIIVSWLARLNPLACFVVAVLFGVLEKGCSVMQSTFSLSPAVSDILQGIILFFILGFDFFASYRLVFRKEKKS